MSNIDSSPDYEALIRNEKPIDPKDPAYERILKDLQGGIIKNYGRSYALYLFIKFDQNKVDEVKQWIREELASSVTSTWKQLADTETFKIMRRQASSFSGELCKNFLLSYKGYQTLGLVFNNNESNSVFKIGMKQDWERNYRIKTNPPENYWYNPPDRWDVGKDRIDALISLAHDSLDVLKNEADAIINKCAEFGKVTACEAGYHLKDSDGKYIGAFGFAEGISQPLFLEKDYDEYCKTQDINQWNPKASLSLVLVKDPFGAPYSYGSYCVWQKLETNYTSFETKVGELAAKLECERERAYALVIGRFKDGTSLDLTDQPTQTDGSSISNSFNYAKDYDGIKCPLQAHIRKLNPRRDKDDASDEERRKKNRIFRAGITYFDDPKAPEPSDMTQLCLSKLNYLSEVSAKRAEENVESINGVLFVCFQRSILAQFSKLQIEWADKREFPRGLEDKYLEPIVGHPATRGRNVFAEPQEWARKWNTENQSERYPFFGCVKAMGGEFLFAPSISFLKNLS